MKRFSIVVASTVDGGIGMKGSLPWRIKKDMEFFVKITSVSRKSNAMNAVIMGRKTWESIPTKFRPLTNRINVVLTSDKSANLGEGVSCSSSLNEALQLLSSRTDVDRIFIAGGASVYAEALQSPLCEYIYLTLVHGSHETDTKFPRIPDSFVLAAPAEPHQEGDFRFEFMRYEKRQQGIVSSPESSVGILPGIVHEEMQYLNLVKDIIYHGVQRSDRTGTGTLSKFGCQMRFNLRNGVFPLLTTKRVFWRGVLEELLWFVAGSTNANLLKDKNIYIWDGNASREFLDSIGLSHREEGDLGPVYGFQWRHFGAKYDNMHADYSKQGIDQLADVINRIKSKPEDRRIILTAWNPTAIPEMALPPCHLLAQFYVDTEKKELSCQMYQRSADMGLGVPFNIASYALLTYMVAHVTGLTPGDFVHTLADAHVYLNHTDALLEQIDREPRPFPQLKITRNVDNIDAFTAEDFELIGYNPHAKLAMQMAV